MASSSSSRQSAESEESILQGLLAHFSKFNYDKAKEQAVSYCFIVTTN